MNQQAKIDRVAANMAMEKQETTFPAMLYRMLTDIEEMGQQDSAMKTLQEVVSWQEHGRAFRVHNKKKFINVVMPTWFSRIKYSSWVRQLSSYGFQKIHTEGADKKGRFILSPAHPFVYLFTMYANEAFLPKFMVNNSILPRRLHSRSTRSCHDD